MLPGSGVRRESRRHYWIGWSDSIGGAEADLPLTPTTDSMAPQCDGEGLEPGWAVYLLRCADGSLYTGIARDLPRRLRQHNGELAGGARYTRGRRPVSLLWSETCPDRSAAQVREAAIKKLTREQKLALSRRSR